MDCGDNVNYLLGIDYLDMIQMTRGLAKFGIVGVGTVYPDIGQTGIILGYIPVQLCW